jgi:uncharacterized protein YkwD
MKGKAAIATLFVAAGAAGALAPVSPVAAAGLERLIAPASACSRQADPSAPAGVQVRAMRCLTNFARRGAGLPALAGTAALDRAAGRKSVDILRCDEFSHEACGREFTYWIERSGYRGCALGENIAWGTGLLGSVRSIFRSWMHSPGHRENILGPYEEIGIALRIGSLDGSGGAHVWTQDFGASCRPGRVRL